MADEKDAKPKYETHDLVRITLLGHIRKRPMMYIGSKGLDGLARFIFAPINLFLQYKAGFIEVEIVENEFRYRSDAILLFEQTEDGEVKDFETYPRMLGGNNGNIICALSDRVEFETNNGVDRFTLRFENGLRKQFEQTACASAANQEPGATIVLSPDLDCFNAKELSPHAVEHFLFRRSFHHPKVQFRFKQGNRSREFYSEKGLADLFETLSAAKRLLHQPIHIRRDSKELKLELIYAFHGEEACDYTTFLNKMSGVTKGSHIRALIETIETLRTEFGLSQQSKDSDDDQEPQPAVGVSAILALEHQDIQYFSGKFDEINNDFYEEVKDFILEESRQWLVDHPNLKKQFIDFELLSPLEFFE